MGRLVSKLYIILYDSTIPLLLIAIIASIIENSQLLFGAFVIIMCIQSIILMSSITILEALVKLFNKRVGIE